MTEQAPAGQRPGGRGWLARLRRLSPEVKLGIAGFAALVLVAAVVSLTSGGSSAAHTTEPQPAARNFTLPLVGQAGQHVSLSSFAGQPVIVNFFASWCVPCKAETPLLARFYKDSKGKVNILGVDANDQSGTARAFLRAAGVGYPVGFDPFPAPVTTSYGVGELPQTFFLDAQHHIMKRVFGAVTMRQLTADLALISGNPG
ncbi:MAG TPA: TlpA disulfide reductase family protein [Streptosporangiaceae bacterium]|jgi:cytochrome c biogenesis protein CcmG/thiol:disulfide interchange protein DsbE